MEDNDRIIKNIIMIIILIITIGGLVFTGYMAYKNLKTTETVVTNEFEDNKPPMNGEEPPEKTDGEEGEEPPEKPDGEETPSMPSGEASSTMNNNSETTEEVVSKTVTVGYYIAFGVESLIIAVIVIYLFMSQFNYLTFYETFDGGRKFGFIILSILLTTLLTFGAGFVTNKLLDNNTEVVVEDNSNNSNTGEEGKSDTPPEKPDGNNEHPGESNSNVSSSGVKEVVSEEEITSNLEASNEDESVVLVKDGGNAKINGATLTKTGDASNTESSEFKGINSSVLVEEGSATITGSKIVTNAKGSNAVFATGENSKIYVSDTTIETSGSSGSRGLDATYGGTIEADNVTIVTKGGSCATLATDRGEGTVTVSNSDLTTNGKGSPIIYSTGKITITDTNGVANGSQMVVVEGKNSANVTNSTLVASGVGNRNNVDNAGIMIYQSMSGDASTGKGIFNAEDSFLEIAKSSSVYKTAPMFFVTNTEADINLKNTRLTYGSNILLSVVGTSEWGKEGSNGGIASLNAMNQSLKGDIIVDKISELEINLTSSTYRGTINGSNSAKKVVLKLDKDSQITLTGDSYVDVLENGNSVNGNIDFNGFKLYVNGVSIR